MKMNHIHPVFHDKCRDSRQWYSPNMTNAALWMVSFAVALLFLMVIAADQIRMQFAESFGYLAFVLIWYIGRIVWQLMCEVIFWGSAPQK